MKKVLQVIWCWLALGSMFWLIQYFIVQSAWIPDPSSPVFLGVSIVLASLAVWLISRKNLEEWARWLAVVFVSLLTASALAVFTFFAMIPVEGFMSRAIVWQGGAAFLVGLVAGMLISRKGILRGLSVSAAIVVLAVATIAFHAHRQESIIRQYERQWASMDWGMDLQRVFPMPYTKPRCQAWYDAMAVIAPKQGDLKGEVDWQPFYNDVILPLCSEQTAGALQNGQDLRSLILSLPAAADPRWSQYRAADAAVRTAMASCPHVQWFDPAEYQGRLWEAPIPNLLGMMKWSRGVLAQAQIAAAEGRFDEARADLEAIHRGAGKMLIKGQTLIGALIGIAMDKLCLVGEAGAMAMGGEPLPAGTRERIESTALQDLSWFSASWKTELMSTYTALKSPDAERSGVLDLPLLGWIPMKTLIFRALYIEETDNYLFNMTQAIQSLEGGCRPLERRFGWAKHKSLNPKESLLAPNLNSSYGRALSLLAQARLVLMMDEVLKYRQEHKALPEDLDFVHALWRVDPFDEQPLRYKKEGDAEFVVWSVGPDGRDDGAESLYVFGAMEMKDELKEDIGFRIALPIAAR